MLRLSWESPAWAKYFGAFLYLHCTHFEYTFLECFVELGWTWAYTCTLKYSWNLAESIGCTKCYRLDKTSRVVLVLDFNQENISLAKPFWQKALLLEQEAVSGMSILNITLKLMHSMPCKMCSSHASLCSPGYDRLTGLQAHITSSHPISHPPLSSSPAPQGSSHPIHPPVCIDTGHCPSAGAGPCTWPWWTSWGLHGPTPHACWDPPWIVSLCSRVSTTPLGLVSSTNLLRVHSIPLSMSLMKILNSTGPGMDTAISFGNLSTANFHRQNRSCFLKLQVKDKR